MIFRTRLAPGEANHRGNAMNTVAKDFFSTRARAFGYGAPPCRRGLGFGMMLRPMSLAFALALAGAANAESAPQESKWSVSVSGSGGAVGESKLDGGGNVSLGLATGSVGLNYAPDWRRSAGISLSAAEYDFDFSGPGQLASLKPWSKVGMSTVSVPLRYAFDRQWGMFVQPSYQRAGTRSADDGESAQWGGVAALTYAAAPRQLIGLGASVFNGLEKTRVYPILLVDWQLSDKLRLANPLTAGPTGPAGLEIVYALDGNWEVAAGGAYRSLRFRLDRDLMVAPNGVGEYTGVIGFGRLSYRFSPKVTLDLHAGGVFRTNVALYNAAGNTVVSEDAKNAPIAALSFRARF
jgi:hypothetical protein